MPFIAIGADRQPARRCDGAPNERRQRRTKRPNRGVNGLTQLMCAADTSGRLRRQSAIHRKPLEQGGLVAYSALIGSRNDDPDHPKGTTMTATARTLTPRFGLRLTSAVFAALTTLGVVSLISQGLHVDRFGDGAQVVQLDRVTVTAKRAATEPAVAAIPPSTRAN
jgi:hypothetical protein